MFKRNKTNNSSMPTMGLDAIKKDELVEDIFKSKLGNQLGSSNNSNTTEYRYVGKTISSLERVALPVLVAFAVVTGAFFIFTVYASGTLGKAQAGAIDFLAPFSLAAAQCVTFLDKDINAISGASTGVYVAGVNFLGDKISDLAMLGASITVSLIK